MINLFIKQLLLKVGEEPDPRFTLANERTFLAWTRTALALLASAVALITISEHYHQLQKAQQIFNLLVIASLMISLAALIRWYRVELALRLKKPLPFPFMTPVLTLLSFIILFVFSFK
ncbi:YidH family protein [Acinetobacter sp. AKBS16]|uniref:YidH family protein n=1 Tax=Acinetobacter sp. AKBS16 TaxID=2072504 RepID=UPI000CCDE2B9|nr:DUF202 domain-containing protein [Acinetobacter sp. AKBS16]PNW17653.1 hypothetical protein C1642_08670 [Acinetobacter sp. AKBS16]